MTQNFPTSAEVIYNTLTADTSFMSLLGNYTFKGNASTSKAISIVSPGEDLPAVRTVSGVECVIHDIGNIQKYEYLSEDQSRLRTTWSIFLISWEPSTGSDLQVAAEHACRRFHGSESVETVAVSDGIGAMVQSKLFVYSDMPIVGT